MFAPTTQNISKKLLLLAILLVLGYIGLAAIHLGLPGVHFDEALHVNAAIGGIDETFIYKEIAGVPVLLMPYIGGLKAYLTAPFFWIFGVNAYSIRLPMILYMAISLGGMFFMVRHFFNNKIAIATLAITATAPTVIQSTRTDSGPVVLGFAMMIAALYGLHLFIHKQKKWGLLLAVVALALGLFHKLNFIWFVNSFVAGAGIFYWRDFLKNFNLKSNKSKTRLIGIGVATLTIGIVAAILAYYFIASQRFALFGALDLAHFDWQLRVYNVSTNLWRLINGELYFTYLFGEQHNPVYGAFAIGSYVLLLVGFLGALRMKALKYRREYFFFAFLFVTTIAQVFITKNAAWPWHIFTVYPSLTILLAYSLYAIYCWLYAKSERIGHSVVATLFGLLLIFQLFVNLAYVRAYTEPVKNVYWSPAIYELIEYTQAEKHKFVSVDWGTHTQLLTFYGKPNKYFNESFHLNKKEVNGTLYWRIIKEYFYQADDYRFILHPESKSLFKDARRNFLEIVQRAGLNAQLENTIAEAGRPIFEIYRVSQ